MRSLIVLVLPILLLTGCGAKPPAQETNTPGQAAKPSFEGKWTMDITAPNGDKYTNVEEFKADGTMVSSRTDKSGKTDKRTGKWKKTGEKTCEMSLDLLPNEVDDPTVKPTTAELLDAKTLEVTDPDSKVKFKFTKL